MVEFTRIYLNTKYYIKNFDQQELNPDDNDIEELAENQESVYLINHPTQLLILVVAAAMHLTGNIIATFYLLSVPA